MKNLVGNPYKNSGLKDAQIETLKALLDASRRLYRTEAARANALAVEVRELTQQNENMETMHDQLRERLANELLNASRYQAQRNRARSNAADAVSKLGTSTRLLSRSCDIIEKLNEDIASLDAEVQLSSSSEEALVEALLLREKRIRELQGKLAAHHEEDAKPLAVVIVDPNDKLHVLHELEIMTFTYDVRDKKTDEHICTVKIPLTVAAIARDQNA